MKNIERVEIQQRIKSEWIQEHEALDLSRIKWKVLKILNVSSKSIFALRTTRCKNILLWKSSD